MKAIAIRAILLVGLLALRPAALKADEYHCIAQQIWCWVDNHCEGTGFVWAGCDIWCYVNEGQEFSGYADCARPIPT